MDNWAYRKANILFILADALTVPVTIIDCSESDKI